MNKGLLPHYLYRHYDANNNLLYIGITKDIAVRTNEHKRTSRWIKLSSRIELENHKGTYAAAHAEERAIKKERPIYNITFNNDYPAREISFRRDRSVALALLSPATDFIMACIGHNMLVLPTSLLKVQLALYVIKKMKINSSGYGYIDHHLYSSRRFVREDAMMVERGKNDH